MAAPIPPGLLPALDTLFSPDASAGAAARRGAEAWLVAFQRDDGAWQVRACVIAHRIVRARVHACPRVREAHDHGA